MQSRVQFLQLYKQINFSFWENGVQNSSLYLIHPFQIHMHSRIFTSQHNPNYYLVI